MVNKHVISGRLHHKNRITTKSSIQQVKMAVAKQMEDTQGGARAFPLVATNEAHA